MTSALRSTHYLSLSVHIQCSHVVIWEGASLAGNYFAALRPSRRRAIILRYIGRGFRRLRHHCNCSLWGGRTAARSPSATLEMCRSRLARDVPDALPTREREQAIHEEYMKTA